MTGAWQKCIDDWVMKGEKGPEALQAMRVSWAGLDRMRPLLLHALHAMQPSQLRKDPLQAQQAACEALRDLAATCNITAWTHARKLASQVGLLCSAACRQQSTRWTFPPVQGMLAHSCAPCLQKMSPVQLVLDICSFKLGLQLAEICLLTDEVTFHLC